MATDFLDGSHIVGGKNNGRSFLRSSSISFQEFDINGVESAERFIKNQHFRFVQDGGDELHLWAIPLDNSSTFRSHQASIPNFSNQAFNC